MDILHKIWEGVLNTSWLEAIGVFTSIAYVILAARKMIACWSFAILSTSIYIYLCFTSKLFIESGLQLFYLIMGIYGWVKWKADIDKKLPIKRWVPKKHLLNILLSTLLTFLLGFTMDTYTDQESPYVDSFTTIFSLAATFMVTQRVLENWVYWVVIDLAAAYLYASRGFYLTGVQYFMFSIIAGIAFYSWYVSYKNQSIKYIS